MKKNHRYFGLYPVAADTKDNRLIPHIVIKQLPEWSRYYTVKCYFDSTILSFNSGKRVCGIIWRTLWIY